MRKPQRLPVAPSGQLRSEYVIILAQPASLRRPDALQTILPRRRSLILLFVRQVRARLFLRRMTITVISVQTMKQLLWPGPTKGSLSVASG